MFSMDNKIADIISKTITGEELSHDEAAYLDHWINEANQNRRNYELATGITYKVTLTEIGNSQSSLFNKINQRINARKNKIRNLWMAGISAASIVIAFTIGAHTWNKSQRDANSRKDIVYNEVLVPKGAKSQITLTDGTKVWLNGGSKLRYPSSFSNKTREVYLDGEAFFDVSENKSKPFFVHTTSIQIKVLGTAFNVKSYADDQTIETTLVRGLVEIREVKNNVLTKPLLIKPNERATFIKEKGITSITSNHTPQSLKDVPEKLPAIEVNKVNTTPIISWKEKSLVFENATLEDIATKLERWYGIKVHILNDDLKKYRYKGKFSHNETIYQVLEVLKVTTPIKYDVENYEINIDVPKNQ